VHRLEDCDWIHVCKDFSFYAKFEMGDDMQNVVADISASDMHSLDREFDRNVRLQSKEVATREKLLVLRLRVLTI
jgi:hypothetical protein